MKNFLQRLLFTLPTIFLSLSAYSQDINRFNQQADQFFSQYVEKGKVDYPLLKKKFSEIDVLYQTVAKINTKNLKSDELKAFYINAYNLIVIHQITKYYPLKSALDRNGFFDKVKHQVGGESLTLDQIEKGKVILTYKDPRVHFAFSCAAAGCPELGDFAYTPEKIEQQLEQRTKNAINNPEFIRIDKQNKVVNVSMIFKWYEKEFLQESPSIIAYINEYRTSKIPSDYSVNYYEYDWALNVQ